MPSGIGRAPTDRHAKRPHFEMPATVPHYIQVAIKKEPGAWKFFEELAPSLRRKYIGWIESAKRDETKSRRLSEAVKLLAAGKPLGLK